MAYPPVTFATLPTGNVPAADLDECFQAAAPLDSPAFTGTPTAPTPSAGDNSQKLATTAFVVALGLVPRNYIAGYTLSNDGGSPNTVLDIAAGQATDSTNVSTISLTSAFTKSTAGTWVAGSGSVGMGQGLTIANSTWYHVFAIVNAGAVDAYFDTSVSAANKPSGTTAFRRIGSFRTSGAAAIIPFVQDGDDFYWVTLVNDVNANNPGVAAVTRTLTVPTGVNVKANLQANISNTSGVNSTVAYLSDLATTDTAPTNVLPSVMDFPFSANAAGNVQGSAMRMTVRTNTSAQIRSRMFFSDGNVTLIINTLGWTDSRGANG